MNIKAYIAYMKRSRIMKNAIVYSSQTGNTKLLACAIKDHLDKNDILYFGEPSDEALNADIIYVGFWTDKGCCNKECKDFLEKLQDKKVFLFGTAGFGEDNVYFDKVIKKSVKSLPNTAELIGTYMCQGKMPMSVRERYEKMKKVPGLPMDIDKMISNFDKALSHPDNKDVEELIKTISCEK